MGTATDKLISDLISDVLKLGISQTKAIMHITAALGEEQNMTAAAKEAVSSTRKEIDTMIELIDSIAKLYAKDTNDER